MPRATKDQPARPFDVQDAIRRAARCRALRERVGLNIDAFARVAGVTVRSVNRWESYDGRGSCPDGVLQLLENMLERQRQIIAHAVARVESLQPSNYHTSPNADADCNDYAQDGPFDAPVSASAVVGDSNIDDLSVGGEGCEWQNHPVKGAEFSHNARNVEVENSSVKDVEFSTTSVNDAELPVVTLLYYPNQHVYDAVHKRDHGYYGVANANARAVAQELEALGYDVAWKYAENDDAGVYEYDFID